MIYGKLEDEDGVWIPVKKRLPTESGRYLTFSQNPDRVGICYFRKDIGTQSEVTHWAELPSPPENKE